MPYEVPPLPYDYDALELAMRVLRPFGHVLSIGSSPCGKPCTI